MQTHSLISIKVILVSTITLGLCTYAHSTHAKDSLANQSLEQTIYQGQDVETCGWPTVVFVDHFNKGIGCAGTLIHPRVVLYDAGCGDGDETDTIIHFAESNAPQAPEQALKPIICEINPDYSSLFDLGQNWAYCLLPEDSSINLPVTPVVYGCELEAVLQQIEQELTFVGFGRTEFTVDDFGQKRWAQGTLTSFQEYAGGPVITISGDQGKGCEFDMGAPAFVQYADGSWHTLGINVGYFPPGVDSCANLNVFYTVASNAVPWIEEQTGIDITPCHDGKSKAWSPTETCGGFAVASADAHYGEWDNWCTGTPSSDLSKTCGPPYGADLNETKTPIVNIVTPESDSYEELDSLMVSVEVTAEDESGIKHVELLINNELQPSADAWAPYLFNDIELKSGRWQLVARAEDFAGNIGLSTPVTIQIGTNENGSTETGSGEESTGEVDSSSSDSEDNTSTGSGESTTPDSGCDCTSSPSSYPLWGLGLTFLLLLRLSRHKLNSPM